MIRRVIAGIIFLIFMLAVTMPAYGEWIGVFEFRHYDRDGNLIWQDEVKNVLADEGEYAVLDVFLRNGTAPAQFYLRLYNSTPLDIWTLPNLGEHKQPSTAPTLNQIAGGALSNRTYYVKYTWANTDGESLPSAQSTLVINTNYIVTVTVPSFPPGITKAKVYASTVSGSETYQAEITTSGGTWTEPTSGLVSGAPLPTVNSIGEPGTYGYAAQLIERSAAGWPTIALDSGDYQATANTETFQATGGAWGPVKYCVLATTSDNTGKLISYVALSVPRTLLDQELLQVTYKVKLQ